jgi:transcription elongation GreA/GreB family factor
MVNGATVTIGSWVTVKDGEIDDAWHIVQHHEADAMRGHISEDSPLARALLGHGAGGQVKVQGPAGRRLVTILHVG